MRWSWLVLTVFTTSVWASSANTKLESFADQVAPFWQALRPACVMALEPSLQGALVSRLSLLDEHLIASELLAELSAQGKDRSSQWRSPIWTQQDQLEKQALQLENREALREYYFKLQTQTPNPERAQLVDDIQYMSEQLNFTLRKELWKTCHALGLSQMPVSQMETAVEQRWLGQAEKVKLQMKRELAAFYFYSFRQTANIKLQSFADVANGLKPWVDTTSVALSEYFARLRAQLIDEPIVIIPDEADAPFLEDRPWPPAPSQELLQP